ncbi:hypothetical protein HY768_11185 [candidate division TA06 bacterium]|uniref:Uncharacterized protein n=1 Tax=candidate division TA06 bacterium TaxID=2250710 RepID=A0A933IAT0_UNCT6|nr:hypothetical protein [candidate division TA06 bacterium]
MMDEQKLTFSEVKAKVAEHLKTALGIIDFTVTFAKLEDKTNLWKVNVEFKEKADERSTLKFISSALFGINANTGDVVEFQKGLLWKF